MKKYCAIITLLLLGCQPPNDNHPSTAPFLINGDTVILQKSHIISVKTALYQPSFELQGIILPQKQHTIRTPKTGTITQIFVQKNQSIKKDSPILELKITSSANDTLNNTQISSDSNNSDTIFYKTNDNKASIKQKNINDSNNATTITIVSPINGIIKDIYAGIGGSADPNAPLLTISEQGEHQFVSVLPATYQKYLKVGQTVNFTLKDDRPATLAPPAPKDNNTPSNSFAGQVASINPKGEQISVGVHILPNTNINLSAGLQVGGRINYGDLAVGVVVPRHALYNGNNLQTLLKPPHKPPTPLNANIWVIRQNGRLALSVVKVVEYQPDTKHYLVSGISQDSLIATANLPKDAHHKKVFISSNF